MFVVILRYLNLDQIAQLRPAHVEFLARYYDAGTFIVSGKQTTGTGGVIVAKANSRDALLAILHEDPFYTEKAAEYQVFEFEPTRYAPGLEALLAQQ